MMEEVPMDDRGIEVERFADEVRSEFEKVGFSNIQAVKLLIVDNTDHVVAVDCGINAYSILGMVTEIHSTISALLERSGHGASDEEIMDITLGEVSSLFGEELGLEGNV